MGVRRARRLFHVRRLDAVGQRHLHAEGAALALDAVDRDRATHQGHQLAADRQAQAGTAVAARGGGVGLLELLEQARQRIGRDADAGVAHGEAHHVPALPAHLVVGAQLDLQVDRTRPGELEGIPDQVDQHLAQAGRVADHEARQRVVEGHLEPDALSRGLLFEQAGHVADDRVQVEVDVLDAQLARFDLGEVEQVVDDRQQGLGIALAALDLLARGLAQRGIAQREAEHADHARQRSAHLVAHVGQEFGFLARRILGALLGLAQELLVLLQRAVGARQLVGLLAHALLLVAQFLGLALEHAVLLLDLLGARAHLARQLFLLALQAGHAHPHSHVAEGRQQQHGDGAEPRRAPGRRLDRDRQRRHLLAPDAVLVGRAQPEHVGAGIQVGIGGKAPGSVLVDPVLVEAVEAVGEAVAFGRGEVQGRELEREHRGAGRQRHRLGVLHRPLEHARQRLLDRFVEDRQAGDDGARRHPVVADRARIEGRDAVEAAEVQDAVRAAHRRRVEEGALGEAVGGRVVAPGPLLRIETGNAAGGADPQAAVLVLQDRRDRVVQQAFAGGVAHEAHRTVGGRHHAVQAHRGADPDVAAAVLEQRVHLVVAQARRVVGIVAEVAEAPAGAVHQVEAVEGADPHAPAPVQQHRPHDVVGQAGGLARVVAPVLGFPRGRVEPVQAAAGGDPDAAIRRGIQAAHVVGVGVAGQRQALEAAADGVERGQAGAAADPHAAAAIARQCAGRQVGQAVRIARIGAVDAGRAGGLVDVVERGGGADPELVAVAQQRARLVVGQGVGQVAAAHDAGEAAAAQVHARHAGIPGADPEGAEAVAVQRGHLVVAQAVAVADHMAVALELVLGPAPAQQAVVMGADPDFIAGVAVQGRDPPRADAVFRTEAAYLARIRPVEHAPFQPAQAPDPQALLAVHHQRMHRVAARPQAARVVLDARAPGVLAGDQAVESPAGADP